MNLTNQPVITLKQFDLCRHIVASSDKEVLDQDTIVKLLAVVYNKTENEIFNMSASKLELPSFLTDFSSFIDITESLPCATIEGITYYFPETLEDLTFKEWVDCEEVQKQFPDQLMSYTLGILLRPMGEEYDFKKLKNRVELFGNTPIDLFKPFIGFFLVNQNGSEMLSRVYTQLEETVILEKQKLLDSMKPGVGTTRLQRFQDKIFLSLIKYWKLI